MCDEFHRFICRFSSIQRYRLSKRRLEAIERLGRGKRLRHVKYSPGASSWYFDELDVPPKCESDSQPQNALITKVDRLSQQFN